MAVLEEALDWETFQNVLLIPWSKMMEIEEHYQTDSQRKSVALDYWLQRHPAPSWKWIARRLQGLGKSSLAEEVTTKYVRGTVYIVTSIMIKIVANTRIIVNVSLIPRPKCIGY